MIVFPLVTGVEPPPPPPSPNDHSSSQSSSSTDGDKAAPTEQRRMPPQAQEPHTLLDALRPAPPEGLVHVPELKGWCFLELDFDYLQKNLMPELVERHYGHEAGDEYRIAVVTGRPLRIIYQSDPKMTIDSLSRVDASILLFDARVQPNRPPPPPPCISSAPTGTPSAPPPSPPPLTSRSSEIPPKSASIHEPWPHL